LAAIDRHLFVIFGGTGDLATRKLIPSLYRLITESGIGASTVVMGVGATDTDDAGYRLIAERALMDAGLDSSEIVAWCESNLFYQRLTREAPDYQAVRTRIERLERARDLPGNRAFYLALPPSVFERAIVGLGSVGLNEGPGWTRLVVEKPFGTDLESAAELNRVVHSYFDESEVFRIDHYLGKETVQNLLNFRFANPMFESLWNRDRVEHVEITVAESIGIERRSGYYEQAGALRDMVQNHLTQLLSLIAMEPPNSFGAEQVRNEKVKVIEAVARVNAENVVFGQYAPGTVDGDSVPGYRQEDGVASDSQTPTFVGIKAFVDTWRWEGVPFFLRTGKRLPKRLTQIAVTFRRPALCFFHGMRDNCPIQPNVLMITLQPDEGFTLAFNVKSPDQDAGLDPQSLHFSYDQAYHRLPAAYQALLLDIMQGDQTLFVRADEVESSWRLWEPVLSMRPEPHQYAAGTWGPAALDQGVALGGDAWMNR
jgi:glucose-6-phosphate 1-dehydrogenase